MLVHNLEHGGVVLLYRCSSPCPDVVQELSAIFRALPASKYGQVKVVVCPNARIGRRFALLAWTRLDACRNEQSGYEVGDRDVRRKGDLPAPALALHGQEQLL